MRDATSPIETVAVVCPRGTIRELPIALNISTTVVDASGKLLDSAAAQGWVLLEDAYRAEGFEEGWQVYSDRKRAKASGHHAEPLDDAWLPNLVIERRAGSSRQTWKAPAPPKRGQKSKAS